MVISPLTITRRLLAILLPIFSAIGRDPFSGEIVIPCRSEKGGAEYIHKWARINTNMITGGIGGDAINPSGQGGFTAEAVERLADLQESGLREILDVGFAAKAAKVAVDPRLELPIYAVKIVQARPFLAGDLDRTSP